EMRCFFEVSEYEADELFCKNKNFFRRQKGIDSQPDTETPINPIDFSSYCRTEIVKTCENPFKCEPSS
ncbi:hypothetical protein PFISCL1PPCAC_25956, partial [Pristionchus fissidentatus]